jgi:hypothetical protein
VCSDVLADWVREAVRFNVGGFFGLATIRGSWNLDDVVLLLGCEETVQNDTRADRLALFGGGGNDVPTLHAADFQKGSYTLKSGHWNLGHSLER